MGDGKNEHALCVRFERHQVRTVVENGLVNRERGGFGSGPDWIKSRGLFKTPQDVVDSSDEPVAEGRTLLLIPERRGTDFCASFLADEGLADALDAWPEY